jgi:hypothetical protein
MGKAYVVKQENPNSKAKKQAFKENLIFFLKSLFSNDTCVEARKKPWYAAIIIVLVSIFTAMSVIFTTSFRATGASFFDSPLYNLDVSLSNFDQTLVDKKLSLKVSSQKMVLTGASKNGADAWNEAFPSTLSVQGVTINNIDNAYVHASLREVVVDPTNPTTSAAASSIAAASSVPTAPYTKNQVVCDLAVYWAGSTPLADYYSKVWKEAVDFPTATSKTNVIILGETGFVVYKLPTAVGTFADRREGRWDASWVNDPNRVFDLKDLATMSSHGVAYTSTDASANAIASWKELVADGNNSIKIAGAWMTCGIYLGVYAGLALILGLTVFLMTRGKTNPFRIYTFWECQKIAYWASFSPAVLALFGFLIPAYAPLIFIFLYGMRVMWMSMKSLRPAYN